MWNSYNILFSNSTLIFIANSLRLEWTLDKCFAISCALEHLSVHLKPLEPTRTVYSARQCNTIIRTRNFTARSWVTLIRARILRGSMKYLSAVWEIVEAIRRTKAFLINLSLRRWLQNSALAVERKEREGNRGREGKRAREFPCGMCLNPRRH